MVAGVEKCRDRQMHRGHAARGADRADAGFQRRQPLFEYRGRGIGNPGVDMAGTFQVEQRCGVIGILKDVGRGLIDRNRARAGDGIGALAGVQAEGFESRRLGCGQGASSERGVAWEEGGLDVDGGADAADSAEHAQITADLGSGAGGRWR